MYFCPKDRGEMASMVYNWESDEVDAVVVTDGSRYRKIYFMRLLRMLHHTLEYNPERDYLILYHTIFE
jgi:hypothetical protein